MKTIKIIDLLKKIANGEELPALKGEIEKDFSYYVYDKWGNTCNLKELQIVLNDEVEIIVEDKNIDKINWKSCASNLKELDKNIDDLINKINELIDEVNKLKEK